MHEQLNMFEALGGDELLPEEKRNFRKALRHGSGFVDGKKRIIKFAAELNKNDFIDALKKEYGTGGWAANGEYVWFDNKGFVLDKFKEHEKKYTWAQVANEILDLIESGTY